MSLKYISYTQQQMSNMKVSGYSVYVNENHWATYEDVRSATTDVRRYQLDNKVEIYPILREEQIMSKVKEQMIQEQLQKFELDLNYQEWLRDNINEPSEDELNKMEQDFLRKTHFTSNRIVTHKPLNNSNYYPLGEQL